MVLIAGSSQRVLGRDDDRAGSPCICIRVCVGAFRVASYAIRTQERSNDLARAHWDNALWGYVQLKEKWQVFFVNMKAAGDETVGKRTGDTTGLDESRNDTIMMNKLDADC